MSWSISVSPMKKSEILENLKKAVEDPENFKYNPEGQEVARKFMTNMEDLIKEFPGNDKKLLGAHMSGHSGPPTDTSSVTIGVWESSILEDLSSGG